MPGVPSSSPLIHSPNPYDTESHRGKKLKEREGEKQKVVEYKEREKNKEGTSDKNKPGK